jgi:alcohol dehydrogenase (cytochrome c)
MADWHENYSATGAPLVAGGLVIAGTAGGDGGARGFLAAYDPTSYLPQTGLYYVQTLESCGVFTKRVEEWTSGRVYMGGGTSNPPDLKPQKILRAFDIRTGKAVWELPQIGDGSTRSGPLATASGLVFFGEDSGAIMAVDASSGKPLWHFQTSQLLRASPMTYSFDGRQYIAIAAGPNVLAFGLR